MSALLKRRHVAAVQINKQAQELLLPAPASPHPQIFHQPYASPDGLGKIRVHLCFIYG
jgi:hypothetical protein